MIILGVFFTMMSTNMNKQPPWIVEDLNKMNYTLYLPNVYQLYLALKLYLRDRFEINLIIF